MSSFVIKIIACVSMLIDHAAYYFEPQLNAVNPWLYTACRMVGRLAFPLFAMCIAEGAVHTSNSKKYIWRMILFALIAQIPFSMMLGTRSADYTIELFGKAIGLRAEFSVMVTLLLGLLVCVSINEKKHFLGAAALLSAAVIDCTIGMDYGLTGVLLIIALYLARAGKAQRLLVLLLFAACLYITPLKQFAAQLISGKQPALTPGVLFFLATVFAWFFMLLYNGKKGANAKYLIYLFYPLHMLALWFIRLAV